MKKAVALFLFVFLYFNSVAYNFDSLVNVLDTAKNIKVRVGVLCDISDYYTYSNTDSALLFANKAVDLSVESNDDVLMGNAFSNIGVVHYIRGDYMEAVSHYEKALTLKRNTKDEKGEASILNNIGLVFWNQADYNKALMYMQKSLITKIKLNDEQGIANTYNNIGLIYWDLGKHHEALSNFYKSYSIYKRRKDFNNALVNTTGNIGLIHDELNRNDSAYLYFEKALIMATTLNNQSAVSRNLENIGLLALKEKKYQEALDYFNKALVIREKMGEKHLMAMTYSNICGVYVDMNQEKKAVDFCLKAEKIAEEIGALKTQSETYSQSIRLYKRLNMPDKALHYMEKYSAVKDSIYNDESKEKRVRLEMQFLYDKKSFSDSLLYAEEQKMKDLKLSEQKALLEKQAIQKYALFGGIAVLFVIVLIVYKNFLNKKKSNEIISHQKELVEEKNQEILDSIVYAKRLQDAILPPLKEFKKHLPNSFVVYKPKDIVAGDFYWMETIQCANVPISQLANSPFEGAVVSKSNQGKGDVKTPPDSTSHPPQGGNLILFAAADCTGHGVPGAMVSVVCSNALNRAVKEFHITEPGKILDKVDDLVIETFEKSEAEVKDGMDISLCSIKYQVEGSGTNAILQWSGANNPLWIVRSVTSSSDEGGVSRSEQKSSTSLFTTHYSLSEYKADKQPIGKYAERQPFTTHTIELNVEDSIYIFSDGYADQFGGEKGKKFKSSKMKELILSVQNEPMEKQKELIETAFESWKGTFEQVDDICIIGVRI